jgi:prolyl oligopeptidase PreP (S9A serine peptidase family)
VADAPTQPDVSADQSGEEVVDADASAARVEAKVSSPNDSAFPLAAPLNFTSSHVCERHLVTTMDKAKVPLTIIRRKDTMLDGSAPLLLRVYGAYGDILHAKYEADRMPLMDEGWIFALAHVRGGSELGHFHHENGRLMHKKNTFSDFIACAEWLIQNKYCSAGRIVARSHSAGGLAVGAALNLKPQLFAGAIMNVPFVDVLTTMSDPTLPLSVHERDEWGDINNEEVFKYVASYCPYHNIPVGHHYPSVFVSAALEDRRVPPWVPIKYFCRIRDRRRAPTTSPGSSNSNTTMHLDSSAAVTDNADVTDMDPPDLLYVHEHGGHFSDSLLPAKIAAEMAYAKACVGQFDEEQEN